MTVNLAHERATDASQPAWPVLAALAIGYEVVLTALGTFVDFNHNDTGSRDSIVAYLALVGVFTAVALAVFGLVVRTAAPGNADRRALVLAVIAVPSAVVAFWSGLPGILAVAAIGCVLAGRREASRWSGAGIASSALAVLALAVATLMAFVG